MPEPIKNRPERALRVAYDISVLGIGHSNPAARVGIFRVVERVARGLSQAAECDLQVCALHSLGTWNSSLEYLKTTSHFPDGSLPPRDWRARLETSLSEAVARSTVRQDTAAPLTNRGRVLWQVRRALEYSFRRSRIRCVQGADVFHSPLSALPRKADPAVAKVRFLTIYDLIPVRFPHLCNEGIPALMESIYHSLGPDDWAVAISEQTKADLCGYLGMDPDRVFVTPLAADPEVFRPCGDQDLMRAVRRKYGIPDAPYLLSLNTLEPRKNMDHAIRAFARLVHEEGLRGLHFVLVGAKGWRYEAIFRSIQDAGLARENIILTGYVADEDLSALYSGAMAFVYPSLYEGFGLPPLEAMQCGTPVITSDTSSLPEVIGDAGIMLNPHDLDALSQSMLDLYRDANLRDALGTRSIRRAKQFSWDRCIAETLAAYRVALGETAGRGTRIRNKSASAGVNDL